MTFKPVSFSQIRQQAMITKLAVFIISQDGIAQLHKYFLKSALHFVYCILYLCVSFIM